MRAVWKWSLSSCLALALASAVVTPATADLVCGTDTVNVESTEFTSVFTDTFYAFVPGFFGDFSHRDLMFMVDRLYSYSDLGTKGLSGQQRSILNDLANNIADTQSFNVFGLPARHLQLTYEYFRPTSRPSYDLDPTHSAYDTSASYTPFTTGPDTSLVYIFHGTSGSALNQIVPRSGLTNG